MGNNDRYCLTCAPDNSDKVLEGLKRLGAHVVAASYCENKLLVLYKSEKEYTLEQVLSANEVV